MPLQHPIKLLLNPDHVLFELPLACVKLSTRDVILSHSEFNTVEAGVNIGNTSVYARDYTPPPTDYRNRCSDPGFYHRMMSRPVFTIATARL